MLRVHRTERINRSDIGEILIARLRGRESNIGRSSTVTAFNPADSLPPPGRPITACPPLFNVVTVRRRVNNTPRPPVKPDLLRGAQKLFGLLFNRSLTIRRALAYKSFRRS